MKLVNFYSYSSFNLGFLLLTNVVLVATATEQLTKERFQAIVHESGKNVMVKFYQEWCGHCKSMKKDWDALAETYETESSVEIVDVNCGEQEDLCQEHEVRGYPTIKYFVRGEEFDYSGGRGLGDLSEFVEMELKKKCLLSDMDNSCSEKAKLYASKWMSSSTGHDSHTPKEIRRLQGMLDSTSIKPSKKGIFRERIDILKQIVELHHPGMMEL